MTWLKSFEVLKLSQGRRRDSGNGGWLWGILGDASGNPNVPGRPGWSWVRFPAGADDAGAQQYYPPVAIAEGIGSAFLKKGGRRVWIGLDPAGQPEIVRGDRQDLAQIGITGSVTNPLNKEGKAPNPANPFIPLTCEPVNTANTPGFLVTVYPLWYDTGSEIKYFPGTEAAADKIDLESFKPGADDEYCYVVIWLDTDTNALETPTASTPAALTSTFGNADIIAALEGCYAARPNANCIPVKAFYLTGDMTTLTQSAKHIDLRQMVNMPSSGSISFTVAGDTGSSQTITNGNTLTIAGGSGIDTAASATDTLTIAVDSTVIRTTGTQSIGAGLTIDTPTIANLTNAQHNHTNAAGGGQLTDAALSAAVGIAKGGTGQTSKTPAFDALSPTTTKGDLIVYNGTDNVRKAVGANMTELIADSVDSDGVSWNLRPPVQQLRLGVASQIPIGEFFGGAGDTSYVTLTPWLGNAITLYDGTLWRNYNGAPNGYGDISIRLDVGYSGTRTNGSAIITGLADTTQLAVGMSVTGTGIPGSTVINSIDSATQITLNNNASASGTSTLTFKVPVSKVFDVFAFVDGGSVKLQIILWTNDTTRATAIDQTAYTIIKSGDATRRYLGTGLTSSVTAGTIPGIYGSAGRNMALWNAYNRVLMPLDQRDKTDSWAYTSTTIRQARASTDNQFEVVTGLDDISLISIDLTARASVSGATVGIGLDDTTSYNIAQTGMTLIAAAMTGAKHVGRVPLGRHVYSWNEAGTGGNTFLGDNGGSTLQTGMMGFMEA